MPLVLRRSSSRRVVSEPSVAEESGFVRSPRGLQFDAALQSSASASRPAGSADHGSWRPVRQIAQGLHAGDEDKTTRQNDCPTYECPQQQRAIQTACERAAPRSTARAMRGASLHARRARFHTRRTVSRFVDVGFVSAETALHAGRRAGVRLARGLLDSLTRFVVKHPCDARDED